MPFRLDTVGPTLVAAFAAVIAFAASVDASAQLNRTAVSVAGNDVNNCAIATPCRTIGRAISQTNAGGEVVVVDSAGYGAFTVDRAITIEAAPGVYAGITTASGYAVQIAAGASDVVVLRGLTLNGLGTASAGVAFIGGGAETQVENCVITGFNDWAILSYFPIRVQDTILRHSHIGAQIDNAGAPVDATFERVQFQHNSHGLVAWRNSRVTVRDSVAAYNANNGFWAPDGGILTLENSMSTANGTGVSADMFSTGGGYLRLSNAFIVQNDTGVRVGAGNVQSWTNNKIAGNTVADVSGALSPITSK